MATPRLDYSAALGEPNINTLLTIDVDSTVCETYGLQKQGGSKFTLHPRARLSPGSQWRRGLVTSSTPRWRGGPAHTARGAPSFITETFSRVRAAGAPVR